LSSDLFCNNYIFHLLKLIFVKNLNLEVPLYLLRGEQLITVCVDMKSTREGTCILLAPNRKRRDGRALELPNLNENLLF
jgi:hypothetical protein